MSAIICAIIITFCLGSDVTPSVPGVLIREVQTAQMKHGQDTHFAEQHSFKVLLHEHTSLCMHNAFGDLLHSCHISSAG